MSGGGIIIQRAKALLTAANDPSIYGSMSDEQKNRIEDINRKGPADYTEADVRMLTCVIAEVCA